MQTANIRPIANSATYNTWTANTGTKAAAVDPLNPVVHDDDTTYITRSSPDTPRNQGFTLGARPQIQTLSTVKAFVRGRSNNNYSASQQLNVFARRQGVDGSALVLTGLGTALGAYTEGNGTLPRPGGGTWTITDIMDSTFELVVGISAWAGGVTEYRVTSAWIEIGFVGVPQKTGQVILRLSREVRMYRKGVGLFEIVGPSDKVCDPELLDFFQVSHRMMPAADGNGAGVKTWRRSLFVATRAEIDPVTDLGRVLAYDPRSFLTTFFESGHTNKSANAFGDGVMRLDAGCTRSYKRDSKAWIESNDGYVDELGDDLYPYDRLGLLSENYSENNIRRSSFVSGTTGLTMVNANGGGQGTVVVDTAVLKFRSTITPNSIRITALGSPQASDLGFTINTETIPANTVGSISLDYQNTSGGTLEFQITRNVDGWYYNPSTQAWQAGVSTITLPVVPDWHEPGKRYMLENVDVGGSSTGLVFHLIQLNGATAGGQMDNVAHMQFEPTPWVTSRIVTNGASVSRALQSLQVSNDDGKRAWFGQHGTAYIKLFSEFSAATMNAASGLPNYLTLVHPDDVGNYWKLFYNGVIGSRLDLEVKAGGGSPVVAHAPFSPVAWDQDGVWITIRWTSDQGELDLLPYTVSVFVDGIKGTDVTLPGGLPTDAATSTLYIGGNDVDWAANAAMRGIWFTPRVHSDEEILRRVNAA